ncbi:sn-glycerol-3-phosphate ABC transporter ATP-binding protein UgpC [Nitratireductor mangrovi]|uniref:Sn-glycerol-3-phosphate ABC transporter ATP-binding protein UgpC n=1 Tax=Nitratireductor mangrovi TaxID=2599600 RepID=A0A5B8L614_9HYPH|nr:sn-glycerol-3-phosphate ABC transporter ATP-binding protein UgpC [Nitratireductor mangrovi]QDZ03415.1 sn-glycerol-3-phosphate ABC transporter ATP-binding protein UgpC [Nitratireductor mangrovi]
MADIELANVSKSFGTERVIDNLSLVVNSGELIVFLGPSGSGKSTLLRMIAGLESIDSGTLTIGGKRSEHLAPGQRGVAMVFQNYALYPHMTVRENMAFGLHNIRMASDEIERRVHEAARILEMGELLGRRPAQLSGGQRQRVAIGRAIVKEPKAFLFDEPLSNLDAALRVRTRVELAELHQRMKATMIYVTHDQTEAMTLADRIVVLHDRKIEQIGTPMEVYLRPASRFVAGFVGSPGMNFMQADVSGGGQAIARLGDGAAMPLDIGNPASGSYELGIRPEGIRVVNSGNGKAATTHAKAGVVERLGERTLIYCTLKDGTEVIAQDGGRSEVSPGDDISLDFDSSAVHLFDRFGQAYHSH